MTINRRNFIRSASLLTTISMGELTSLNAKQLISTGGREIAADDEAYWQNVRDQFPIMKSCTYLNNGTVGPSPVSVSEAVKTAIHEAEDKGNFGSYEATMHKIAKFVGANDDEIALTHNVTEGINIACWGVPLKSGDEVILTTHEHVGNAAPWMNRMKLHGIVLKKFAPAGTAAETLNRINALINKRTRAIAVPHMPCTQGQVLPVKEICTLAHDKGLFSLIDGAHGTGMMPLDLHDMGCDTYASCCHKWLLGPKGTGYLYVRKDFQDTVQSIYSGGGTGDDKWNLLTDPVTTGGYVPNAHRYFGGTQNNALYGGVNAAIDFMETIGIANIYDRVKALGKYTQDSLLALGDKIEMLTPTEEISRCAIIGFRIRGVDYKSFFDTCLASNIRIRMVPEDGINCLRVSTHIYNNRADVDKLVGMVKKA